MVNPTRSKAKQGRGAARATAAGRSWESRVGCSRRRVTVVPEKWLASAQAETELGLFRFPNRLLRP